MKVCLYYGGIPTEEIQMRKLHLNKSGSGFASKTACGRNLLRTPMSGDWEMFKAEPFTNQCDKCAASAHAAFHFRQDQKKASKFQAPADDSWVPVEDPNAWMAADKAMIAAHKAK